MTRSLLQHTLSFLLITLVACGSRSDSQDENPGNQWTVEDNQDMNTSLDMRQPDMTVIEPDMRTPSRADMFTPPEDMEMVADQSVDMPAPIDSPPDMPPRRCEGREPLPRIKPGDLVRDTLFRGRPDEVDYAQCPSITPALAHSYVLEIEEEVIIDIWTTYLGDETSVPSPKLFLEAGCTLLSGQDFIGCSRTTGDDEEGRSASIRQRLAPGDYLLTIAERSNGVTLEGGDYVIHVDTVDDLEPNGTCEDAEPLTPNMVHANELTSGLGDRGRTNSCFEGRNLIYYTLDVPPKHGAELSASYTAPVRDIFIRVDTNCERDPQSFCEQGRWINGSERVSWANETDVTQRYVIALDIDQRIPFTIINKVEPLASNAFCEAALPVALNASSPEQPWIQAGSREQLCFTTDRKRSFYYSVSVPDAHRLHLYGTGASIRTGCGDVENQCLPQPYINRSGQPEDVILMTSLQDFSGESSSVMPLAVPLASNSACDSPTPLDPGGTPLVDQDILAGSELFNLCTLVTTEEVITLYYSLAMQLGGPDYRITAEANDPANNASLSLQVLQRSDDPAQCVVGQCRASSDAYFNGGMNPELTLSPNFGEGRDPIPTLIAVTMAAPSDPAVDTRFSIRAEPILP